MSIKFITLDRTELPKITEDSRNRIVLFGSDNNYPQILIDALNTAPIHNAIVTAKTKAICSDGIHINGIVTPEAEAMFLNWSKSVNDSDDLNDIVSKIAFDFEVFGAFALEIIWSKSGKNIVEINHIDVSKIRLENFTDGISKHYYYSRNWTQTRKAEYKPVCIPAYNPATAKIDNRQILYVKQYRPGNEYYGIPNYVSALSWIALEGQLGLFHLSNIQNGLTPSMHISFKDGKPTADEKDQIFRDLVNNMSGSQNTGKFFLTFSDGSDTAPEIVPIATTGINDIYISLNEMLIQNVLTAHRVTSPMLLGIKTTGQLGGSSEIDTAYQIFDKTVINDSRKIIEKTINKILPYIVEGIQIYISPASIIDFHLSEAVLSKILTINELRVKVGFPELSSEEESTLPKM